MINAKNNAMRSFALRYRHRIFEEVINLDYDSLPYIGHLVTKNAIEKGFVEKRKNLKGQTIAEWSRSEVSNGRNTPNQWACLSGVDLLVSNRKTPEIDDLELWACIVFYWSVAYGPFQSLNDIFEDFPSDFLSGVNISYLTANLPTL